LFIIGLALIPTIVIICGVGFCLISGLIKAIVLALSIVFFLIFFLPMTGYYILKAKHLLFVTVVEGTAGRTLAPLLGAATSMMLCACLMFVL
jgi:hypothetical protein